MDLQLNITVPDKVKKVKPKSTNTNSDGYHFVSKPTFTGKTIARKRPKDTGNTIKISNQPTEKHQKKEKIKNLTQSTEKQQKKKHDSTESQTKADFSTRLRELSENKGKYEGKNYQELSDELRAKAKPRSGGWISSLFKNNPEVPKVGQRLVKPLVEKVFSGKLFSDLNIHPHSVANLQQNLGLKELTTVQQKASPIMLEGRDVLVRSQTGSGKTLAYALPLIEGLQAIRPKINRHDGIRAIIVVPTRELAVQTYELFVKLVKPFTWIVPGLLSGGQKRKAEKARLRKGLSVLIGTPGRINDHLRHTQSLNFAKTRCLVLDEADRLLDMGYEKDVAAIVNALESHKAAATYDPMALVKQTIKKSEDPEPQQDTEQQDEEKDEVKHKLTKVLLSDQRQTVLLSATLTKAVENLAGLTMVDPVFVDTSEGRVAVIADSLKLSQSDTYDKSESIEKVEKTKKSKLKGKKEQSEESESEQKKVDAADKKTKEGLRQESGSKLTDLSNISNKKDKKLTLNKVEATTTEDSDSDSDYEYFREQKQVATQNKESSPEAEDQEQDTNKFQEAIERAVEEDELMIPASVVQKFLITPMKLRLVTLCAMILQHCVLNKKGGKMIVFMATTEMVDYHAELLETVLTGKNKKNESKNKKSSKNKKHGSDNEASSEEEVDSDFEVSLAGMAGPDGLVPVQLDMFALHGSMPHPVRIDVFNKFRAAKNALLLCTDVAARGLDLPRVDVVLQYCAPASATDYVHRVGRTGRATHAGAATLLLLPSEAEFVRYLEEKRIRLSQEDDRSVLDSLRVLAPGASSSPRAAVATQASLEHLANSNKEWLARASRAYTSWVRFYAAYPRPVKPYLDSRSLHLGHAAKAFALRDTPGAVARRVKSNPAAKEKPSNRLTVDKEREKRRPGFPKAAGGFKRSMPKQSSMHTASEFDSGLEPLPKKKKQ